MTQEQLLAFKRRMETEMFISAYLLLLTEVKTEGSSSQTTQLAKELWDAVRHKAYMLATKKADNRAIEMESLLKLIAHLIE